MTRQSAAWGLIIFTGMIGGCAPTRPPAAKVAGPMPLEVAMKLIDRRDEWTAHPPINVPRHPAEKFLKDLTIVIDPGHGGTDGGQSSTRPAGYKAGPRGEKEAYMNLRVAKLLERLLLDAGTHVIMTRHGDDTVGLRERAEIANNAQRRRDGGTGADLFISIHHNAGSRTSNYSSVWYHGSVDDNEPDMDLARYIALELGRAMRTQVAKTSPIFSSQLMYDGGFAVLRHAKMPGVLCECSFFSVPEEEQRLRDAGYNLREAYAIYVGLCEYAYCGRPTQTTPTVSGRQLTTTLDEGLPNWWGGNRSRTLRSSVQVTLGVKRLPIEFDELSRTVTAALPSGLAAGVHTVGIYHANMFKNHNFPQRYELKRSETGQFSVVPLPPRRPSSQPATRATTRP